MEYKVDRETAVLEFEKFCDENALDRDESLMSSEDLEDFKPLKERFVKACMEGRVTVDGKNLVYVVSDFSDTAGEEITVTRPKGHAFMAMDSYKNQQAIHKLQGFISAMTGKESKVFSKMDIKDWSFFRDVATLFLLS